MKTKTTFRIAFLTVFFYSLSFISLQAADITSAQNGAWTATSTWVGGAVPTKDDNVTIATGHTVNYFVSAAIIVDLCTNLIVNGTLQASNTLSTNLLFNIYGSIECNGVIELGQVGPSVTGMIVTYKGTTAALTGTGSVYVKVINLNVQNTNCVVAVPTLNCTHGFYVGSVNSTLTVNAGTTVNVIGFGSILGVVTVAQNGGQATGICSMDISGTINCQSLLLCNNATGTAKSAINVKSGGTLYVSTEVSPLRKAGAAGIIGTVGGTGFVFTVESGGKFNFTSPATDPRLLTISTNDPYDPNLEVIYADGSYINNVLTTTTQTKSMNDINRITYNSSNRTLTFMKPFNAITLYNSVGQIVKSYKNIESSIQIPANCKGICIVRLTNEMNENYSFKLNVVN
ncbi:MAG: hypothetical protein GZ091_15615 [Paludibacter sp.]|nr:hypothetical protein [Paludibacter sp.]